MATAQSEIIIEPRPFRWTREQYYRMGEVGLFDNQRVELIEGKVFEMSPINSPHATAVSLADEVLREVFGKGWIIRIQAPLSIGETSDPQPDVAVVLGQIRDFKDAHPSNSSLILEVAESSLSYDRNYKASFYAKSGIADYWVVNLKDRQIEVHRRPMTDSEANFGFSYADKLIFKEGEEVSPLAKPDSLIAVIDLLP